MCLIGCKVNDYEYGRGRVLDYGFDKGTYRVEFEKAYDGMRVRTVRKERLRYI